MGGRFRLLIDCHNVKGGGAKQVASSTLTELAILFREGQSQALDVFDSVHVLTNPDVASDLPHSDIATLSPIMSRPFPRDMHLLRQRRTHDVTWTIFGPRYIPAPSPVSVVGFADVTAIWPRPKGIDASYMSASKQAVRGRFSRFSHSKANLLIVESLSTASQLRRKLGANAPPIAVVPNSLHSVYFTPSLWADIDNLPLREQNVHYLAYPARGYPHKNHRILSIVSTLLERHGLPVRFVTTLDQGEATALGLEKAAHFTHLGPLNIQQIPTLLRFADAILFPSLLEAFSATPLETVFMGKPLIASDRPFVRDFVGGMAHYFEPTDPASIVAAIRRWLSDEGQVTQSRYSQDSGSVLGYTPMERLEKSLALVAGAAAEHFGKRDGA